MEDIVARAPWITPLFHGAKIYSLRHLPLLIFLEKQLVTFEIRSELTNRLDPT